MTHSCPTRRSSDLETCPNEQVGGVLRFRRVFRNGRAGNRLSRGGALQCQLRSSRSPAVAAQQQSPPCPGNARRPPVRSNRRWSRARPRSEEHTSELQSLMRTSYDVFCLKKEKQRRYKEYTQKYK